ncbi:MAG: tagatose 1,6-diphosphate aldolase [Anaerolineaceae bacterium]|nr:tagatose 1,6-diphosphate aldolase [Anaerolineaceae bacterium]
MKATLTPGRWRGLKTTSTSEHVFTIMAFDQRGSYVGMLPEGSGYDDAVAIKSEVVGQLSPYTSAVLLDANYGLLPAMQMHRNSGLLMALEKSGYTGDSTMRRADFDPDWTVAKMRRAGAAAVKLLIYYHPGSGALADDIEGVISRILADCHEQDLPLFVEPMSYSLDPDVPTDSPAFAEGKPEVVIETARRISALGVDVLKMEFPMNAKYHDDENEWLQACETLSNASKAPWVLLSAGVDFEIFERQVRVACQGGASGYLGGRAIWKECAAMSPGERHEFLLGTAMERIGTLNDHTLQQGRPWTDFYDLPQGGADWYQRYG